MNQLKSNVTEGYLNKAGQSLTLI